MTQTGERTEPAGPEGLIFLPEADRAPTLAELDKEKFAVMQLRGKYSKLTPDEQMAKYKEIVAAEEGIRARDGRLGSVALSVAV